MRPFQGSQASGLLNFEMVRVLRVRSRTGGVRGDNIPWLARSVCKRSVQLEFAELNRTRFQRHLMSNRPLSKSRFRNSIPGLAWQGGAPETSRTGPRHRQFLQFSKGY